MLSHDISISYFEVNGQKAMQQSLGMPEIIL